MAEGDFTTARRDLTALLQKAPDNGELENLRGECEQAAGAHAEAAEWFMRAIRHVPGRVESYVRLAQLLRGPLQLPKRADQVMNDLVKANPRSGEAFLARARYRRQYGPPAEAAKDLARALALAPDQEEVLLAVAQEAAAQGDLERARVRLRRGLERYPRRTAFYSLLGAVEQQAGRHPEALACLRQGLKAVPPAEHNNLRLALLDVLVQGGEDREAEETLAVLKKAGWSPLLPFHEARLLMRQGRCWQAVALLERVRPQLARDAELRGRVCLLLGECYARVGNLDQRLSAYRAAVEDGPRSLPANEGLAAALLALGRTAEAVRECRRLMAGRDAPAAGWSLLARALVLHNRAVQADERDWEEVLNVLDRAAQVSPPSPEIPLLRAEALLGKRRFPQARVVLEHALALGSPDGWICGLQWRTGSKCKGIIAPPTPCCKGPAGNWECAWS